MNLFEVQERLKDFSKDQLVQEMQMPSGTAPPFLVLSELQRRTRMEQAMQADGQGQPQSTVAEDAVNAAGVPQGGLQDMARALAPRTDMVENDGVAPVQPMQEGGQVKSGSAQLQSVIEQAMGGASSPVVPQIMSYADRIAQLPVMAPPAPTTPSMPVTPTPTPMPPMPAAPAMPNIAGMSQADLASIIQTSTDQAMREAALAEMQNPTPIRIQEPERDTGGMQQRASGGLVKYAEGGLAGVSPLLDTRSGLERMEDEQETSRLLDESPTVRALRLSEIGADVGEFINEVGLNAIRQADALLAGGASLGARGAAGGTAALGALASVLGFPDTGAMLERTANRIAQKRSAVMADTDSQRMPLGIPAPRLLTSPEVEPFTVPQEARNMYTEAEVMRRLEGLPEDSGVFAEGAVTDPLLSGYGLLPGSTGPTPSALNVTSAPEEMPTVRQRLEPLPTSTMEGGPLSAVPRLASPDALPEYDVSTGVPVSPQELTLFPSQADLDLRYAEEAPADRFPDEDRIEADRRAAEIARAGIREGRVPLQAFGDPPPFRERALDAIRQASEALISPFMPETVEDVAKQSAEEAAALRDEAGITESLRTPEEKAAAVAAAREASTAAPATTRSTSTSGRSGPGGAAPAPASEMSENERMLNQDKWFALAEVGAILMESRAPTFGQALGEATRGGLARLSKAREDYLERKQAAELMALRRAAAARGGRRGSDGPKIGIDMDTARLLAELENEISTLKSARSGMDEGGFFRGEDPRIEKTDARIKELEDRRVALLNYYAGGFEPQGPSGLYSTTDVRQ